MLIPASEFIPQLPFPLVTICLRTATTQQQQQNKSFNLTMSKGLDSSLKEDIPMINKLMKICSMSLTTRENHKTTNYNHNEMPFHMAYPIKCLYQRKEKKKS